MTESYYILRNAGIRVTPQRLAVFEILKKGHLSAEDIFKEVKKRYPNISLATVYAILENFIKHGLATELRIDFKRSLFDSRPALHHHFFCNKCGKIYDLDIEPCPTLLNRNAEGHKIESFQGYFYGTCRRCKRGGE